MNYRRLVACVSAASVLIGTAVGSITAAAAAADTTADPFAAVTYQHDSLHDGDSPDPAFVAPFTKAWSTTLGGSVGYPLVADGRVFVTVDDQVEALSLATGDVLWGPKPVGGTYGMVSIAYDGGRVFAVNFDGLLEAFDAETGAQDWITSLAGQYAFTSPPTAADGTVYVGGAGIGGTLYAVDEATGTTTWTAAVMNGDHSSPVVDDSGVYVSYACEQTYRFDLEGTLVWHHETGCEGGGGRTAVLHAGRLYVRDASGMSPVLLDAGNGELVGTFKAQLAPALAGDRMAAVSAGELTLFSVSTGDPIWHSGADDYVTAPLIANGYVIEGRSDGTVDARELQDGRVVWSGRAGAGLTAPDEHNAFTLSGLAEGDGALVVPAGTTLTAFVPAGDTNVAITGGPAPDAVIGPTATFSFDSDVPNAQYTCTLDGDSAPCTSPTTFTGLDDGKHHFSVEIAFATSGAAATAFRVDAVGPSVLLERFRPMETTKATATAHWSASDDRSGVQEYQLRVRRAPFGTALPSWSVRSPTTAGSATLHLRPSSRLCASVRAEDGVGNWSGWSSPQCVRRVAGTG